MRFSHISGSVCVGRLFGILDDCWQVSSSWIGGGQESFSMCLLQEWITASRGAKHTWRDQRWKCRFNWKRWWWCWNTIHTIWLIFFNLINPFKVFRQSLKLTSLLNAARRRRKASPPLLVLRRHGIFAAVVRPQFSSYLGILCQNEIIGINRRFIYLYSCIITSIKRRRGIFVLANCWLPILFDIAMFDGTAGTLGFHLFDCLLQEILILPFWGLDFLVWLRQGRNQRLNQILGSLVVRCGLVTMLGGGRIL